MRNAVFTILCAFLVVTAPAPLRAQYSEPAFLIVEAHTKAGNVTDPVSTPDMAISEALAWAAVRHRVTLLTHEYTKDDMQDRLKAKRKAIIEALQEKNTANDELARIQVLLNSIQVESYGNSQSATKAILNWEQLEFRKNRACFGLVSFLGHGALVNGLQCLHVPSDSPDHRFLDIDGLRNRWRYHFLPMFVLCDLCQDSVKGDITIAERGSQPRRAAIGGKNDIAAFVREARAHQWPLDSEEDGEQTATAAASGAGPNATDCKDLLAASFADGIQVASTEGEYYFARFGQGIEALSAEELFQYSYSQIGRMGSKQKATPQAKFGILTRHHVVAIANPQVKYVPPAISFLPRWYANAAQPDTEIKTWMDEATGAVVIRRNPGDSNDASWVYAEEKQKSAEDDALDEERFTYQPLIESGRLLEIVCMAKSLPRGKTLEFQVEFSNKKDRDAGRFDRFITKRFSLAADRITPCLIRLPAAFDRLAITSIPNVSIAGTWPANAELHLLSMRLVLPTSSKSNTYTAPWPAMFKLWYPQHVLCSNPDGEVTRVSNGQLDWVPTFGLRTNGAGASRKELAGVGGPMYAQQPVDPEHALLIKVSARGNAAPQSVTVCVLAGEDALLTKKVTLGQESKLVFEKEGVPDYLALLSDEDCVLELSVCRIGKTSSLGIPSDLE